MTHTQSQTHLNTLLKTHPLLMHETVCEFSKSGFDETGRELRARLKKAEINKKINDLVIHYSLINF